MLDCSLTRGPCSAKPAPGPPPCPSPPPPPFPWIYVWPWLLLFSVMGAMYRYYLWWLSQQGVDEPVWQPRKKTKCPFHDVDLPTCSQYVIVGAGSAGWAAYKAIMEHHPTAKVLIISEEDALPYVRPPMSKYMWWNPQPPDIKTLNYLESGNRKTMYLAPNTFKFMDAVKFYRKEIGPAVSLAFGWHVARVDPEQHAVYIKGSCGLLPIYYERCLLATGSSAKTLPVFKSAPKPVRKKVSTLRTIRDLEIAYRAVRAARHVVIVGGGPLGTELAWHLGKMNQIIKEADPEAEVPELVHIIKDKGILTGIVPEYLGEWALEKVKCEGTKIITKALVHDAFVTKDNRLQLTLSDGSSVVTDFVLVAVGAEPNTEIGLRSNLELDEINGGFVANTELEARKHLFVAGDAASIYTEWKNTRTRFENISNAIMTGNLAGTNMAGYWQTCNIEPHFFIRLGEDVLNVEVIGEVGACMPTIGIFKICDDKEDNDMPPVPGDKPCYKKTAEYKNRYRRGIIFYLREEHVVGMTFWNVPPVDDRLAVVTEMLRARPTYKDINMLAELLGFPETLCFYPRPEQNAPPCPVIKYREF